MTRTVRILVIWLIRIGWIGITLMLRKNVVLMGDDRLPNAMGSAVMMVGEVAQPAHVRQDLLVTSVPVVDIRITVPVGDIPMVGNDVPITAGSADPRKYVETVHGMPVYCGGDLGDSDCETPGDND